MNWFTRLLLRYICKRIVRQGYWADIFITEYYQILYSAAEKEYTEDNKPSLNDFLYDCWLMGQD